MREAALFDAQDFAEVLIYAEAKLGELLAAIPNKKASSSRATRSLPPGIDRNLSHRAKLGELLRNRDTSLAYKGLNELGGRKPDLPTGISHKLSHQAQTIANNLPIVEHKI